jgi:hypothetical protein
MLTSMSIPPFERSPDREGDDPAERCLAFIGGVSDRDLLLFRGAGDFDLEREVEREGERRLPFP